MSTEPVMRNWREYVGRFSVEFDIANHEDVVQVKKGFLRPEQIRRAHLCWGLKEMFGFAYKQDFPSFCAVIGLQAGLLFASLGIFRIHGYILIRNRRNR